MENRKPFLTVDEQIDLLESRGMTIDKDPHDVLMREGYYQLVNGYKDLFIDQDATNRAGDDRYLPGTTFTALHVLFMVDRLLRQCSFMALIQAENTFKNAVVYSFCDRNRSPDAYLRPDVYCGKQNYIRQDLYDDKLAELIRVLNNARSNSWRDAGIEHYLREYGHVPLWVLSNALTFGNISHFYAMQPLGVKTASCRIIAKEQGLKRIKPTRLGSAVATLVSFRNICAHDSRLYCARTGGRHRRYFADMMVALRLFVDELTMNQFLTMVTSAVKTFDVTPILQERVMRKMHVELSGGSIQPTGGWNR